MANFNINGFEDIEQDLMRESERSATVVPAMLNAGADILVKEQKKEVRKTFGDSSRSTGALEKSLKKSKVKSKGVKKTIEVSPTGKDKKGVRNAEKGFILEYGKHGYAPNPWMTRANEKCENEVHGSMRRVWESE